MYVGETAMYTKNTRFIKQDLELKHLQQFYLREDAHCCKAQVASANKGMVVFLFIKKGQ
jgi:hypothetical protein